MKSEESGSSDLVDNVKKMSISHRGRIRTRGGRLPPIRHREIEKVTGVKKIIAPKIPQRRIKKEEKHAEPVMLIKKEPTNDRQDDRDRGRGRGQKVFLQTEGSFLAQGPAAKIKRDPIDSESRTIIRAARSTARDKVESEVDIEVISGLLSSYEANEAYEDESGTIPPYRLPLLKEDMVPKVKTEPLHGIRIKKEVISDDEDMEKPDTKNFKLKTECKTEFENSIEEFCNVKDEGMLFLLQWPSILPFSNDEPDVKIKIEDTKKEVEPKTQSFVDELPEGQAGKLQILKSGRKRLVLGSMAFELIDGTESESSKELVSIRMGEDGGDISVIGKIDKTMVARPLVNQILEERDIMSSKIHE